MTNKDYCYFASYSAASFKIRPLVTVRHNKSLQKRCFAPPAKNAYVVDLTDVDSVESDVVVVAAAVVAAAVVEQPLPMINDDDNNEPALFPPPVAAPLAPPVDPLIYQRLAERLTALTPEQVLQVRTALSPPWSEDVLVENFGIPVTRRILKCLNPRLCLNDEIMNYYMQLLQEWDKHLCDLDHTRRPSLFFNLFFMNKLLPQGKYRHENVKR